MRLSLFGRKPPRQDDPLPEGDHGPASKALAAIIMANDILTEEGLSEADGDHYHSALGRCLARFHKATDHSNLETNTLGAALKIYCSPIAAETFAEEAGGLSGAAMLPVFEVYEVACARRDAWSVGNPFFGPAAILWDAGMNGTPPDDGAVRSASDALTARIMR